MASVDRLDSDLAPIGPRKRSVLVRRLLRLQRLSDFVARAAPHVDPLNGDHDAVADSGGPDTSAPSAGRPVPRVPSVPRGESGTESASDALLRTPTNVAPVADDFFDGIVQRVEGDR